ncbi:tRNA (adenosine(37)-N6)-threonylcarbamoyltransferase complex ATPase subunit type 1 TsaE [Aestuariicoccus sp. MJ-SS9]|uniref:tRNA (adenosine(37)-N6)-threonylcarbamoyltransferase complex ATPase subunit type 1 TsaE n=1 Tax=Aestuariicoccus sp. MJ-SS9 TaxID=3079855 RepID=UPI0029124502|nr:tRNA (adenosine(37)-N6)-threonylcarbamoyltransferase complex ATPase subunit type 1 TsaE [Aestuariicoccus sp. MJ-SS9]MDU8910854.1 tRNA (adenosine(37)-N6)-threonylcarbamoyltransferase complex ATPase subunit type 1 TsaE [Aestuariicoccus sp. MJ-SS9]
MSSSSHVLLSRSPDDTARHARRIGAALRAGDVILLTGSIGAGKTHFARALIQSLLDPPEDVPSPTFTLVQTYDTPKGELWHADLYRLGDPDQCVELGLTEAFETAICLVEWPEILGDMVPARALRIGFDTGPDEDTRRLTFTWTDPRWDGVLAGLAA